MLLTHTWARFTSDVDVHLDGAVSSHQVLLLYTMYNISGWVNFSRENI
uniref:Uncharacterized protein n=1 Tax=Arundo donax TaxID=35708 RepID=A0A0A9FM37_ARUDO